MARKDRTGNRKPREQHSPIMIPELGYYLVVTDTEATDRCYFRDVCLKDPLESVANINSEPLEATGRNCPFW